MASRKTTTTRIKIGDRVRFMFGFRRTTGTVIEDLGPIGIEGRRVFAIEFPIAESDPKTIELQVDEFEVVKRRAA